MVYDLTAQFTQTVLTEAFSATSRQMLMMQGMNIVLADTPVSGCHVTFVINSP